MTNPPTPLALQQLVDPPPQRKPRREVTLQELYQRRTKLTERGQKLTMHLTCAYNQVIKVVRKRDALGQQAKEATAQMERLQKRIAALEAAARRA